MCIVSLTCWDPADSTFAGYGLLLLAAGGQGNRALGHRLCGRAAKETELSLRLRSDIWVSAFLRRSAGESAPAMLARRGAAEAGAIFIVVDRLDGSCALYGPAAQSEVAEADAARGVERRWTRLHADQTIATTQAGARLAREVKFDADLWIIEVEDRQGRVLFDVAE